jgi:hypothetical protein
LPLAVEACTMPTAATEPGRSHSEISAPEDDDELLPTMGGAPAPPEDWNDAGEAGDTDGEADAADRDGGVDTDADTDTDVDGSAADASDPEIP